MCSRIKDNFGTTYSTLKKKYILFGSREKYGNPIFFVSFFQQYLISKILQNAESTFRNRIQLQEPDPISGTGSNFRNQNQYQESDPIQEPDPIDYRARLRNPVFLGIAFITCSSISFHDPLMV